MTAKHREKKWGFELLHEQTTAFFLQSLSDFTDEKWRWGDTPIERLLSAALYLNVKYETYVFDNVRFTERDEHFANIIRNPVEGTLYCGRQVQFTPTWRVDFILAMYATNEFSDPPRPPQWYRLIVECDGHDFHERTKEQASKDRSRDREAQLLNVDVFRFTGSEIWKDPFKCARQISEWGFGKYSL